MRYSQDGTDVILAAAAAARELGHGFVGSIHLCVALARDGGIAGNLLRQMGLSGDFAWDIAALLYGVGHRQLPLPQGFSQRARKCLRAAAGEAALLGSKTVRPIHILIALSRQEEAEAMTVLAAAGIDPDILFTTAVERSGWERTEAKQREGTSMKLLEQFSEDLLQKVPQMDPGGGDRNGHRDPQPEEQEQPGPGGASRCGQDRHCRGAGPTDGGGECAAPVKG